MADERKMAIARQEQLRMRAFLSKLVNEMKTRDGLEHTLNEEQATMWNKDTLNYQDEEAKIYDKVQKVNKENADFLMRQMEEKR